MGTLQEEVRLTALGRYGLIPNVMKNIRDIPEPARTQLGKLCNQLKYDITELINYTNELEEDVRKKDPRHSPARVETAAIKENKSIRMDALSQIKAEEDIEVLGKWYCKINTYRWPEGLGLGCKRIEDGTIGIKAVHETLCPLLHEITRKLGRRGVSRAWWIYQLKRTEEEWLKWWGTRPGL